MQNITLKIAALLLCLFNVINLSGQAACDNPECITEVIDISTGIDHLNGNAPYPPGAQDDHWEITNSPNGPLGQATVINPDPNWMPGFGTGQWVSINAAGMAPGPNLNPAAPYTFQRCFCNCQNDFWIDDLTVFAADQISEIRLDGTVVYSNPSNVFDPADAQDGVEIPRWASGGNGTFCLEVDIRKLTEEESPIGLLVSGNMIGFDLLREECCNVVPPPPPMTCDLLPDDCRTGSINLTTGLNPDGSAIDNDGTLRDPIWQIIQEPNGDLVTPYNPFVVNETAGWNGWNFPVNSPAPGQWLSPTSTNMDSPGNNGVDGSYTYERCFCTCDEGEIEFNFTAFGDNFVNSIRVGNNVLYTIPPNANNTVFFRLGIPIVSTLDLPAGQHCIQVDVSNAGNQTGFKMEGLVSGATLVADGCCTAPEPVECCDISDAGTVFHEDFDPGFTGFNTDYDLNTGNLNPGEYDFVNSTQASALSAGTWDVVGHTNCDPGEQFMVINGRTGGTGLNMVYESINLPLASNQDYDFCVQLKHLPQCVFDVVPTVQVEVWEIAGGGNNLLFQSPLTSLAAGANNCDYQTISGAFTSNGATPFSIYRLQIRLDETGVGDGNDLAIDDVVVNRSFATSNALTRFQTSTMPAGGNLITITGTADQPLPEDCTAFWEVWEVTDPFNPTTSMVAGTYASGDVAGGWGDSHDFPGYCCAPVLGGQAGIFEEDRFYAIRRSVECDCESENTWMAVIMNQEEFVTEGLVSGNAVTTKLSVVPNPFTNSFALRLPRVLTEATTARIISINGAVVKEVQLQAGELEVEIEMSTLPSGMYLLQTYLDGEFHSTKLIKQ